MRPDLGPLTRYLRSQVGRAWDDVYSEISRCLRPTSAVQRHVRDHLWDFVSQYICFHDGLPYDQTRRYWRYPVSHFYVCPNSARLCEHLATRKGGDRMLGKRGCRCKDCRARR